MQAAFVGEIIPVIQLEPARMRILVDDDMRVLLDDDTRTLLDDGMRTVLYA